MYRRRKKVKRIGVFGGTFGPIHYGHLVCAEWARQAYRLDVVLFVTGINPPNKPVGVLDAEDRHAMVVAAVAENPYFEASRIDLEHGGSGYTLMTIEGVRQKYGSDVEVFYLMSSEYLDPEFKWYLPNWVGGKELFNLCRFLVFPREDTSIDQVKEWAKLIPQAKIDVAYVPSPDLSSTIIRDLVAKGRSIAYTTPWVVQQMIAKKGHFRTPETPKRQPDVALCDQQVNRLCIYPDEFNPIHYGHLLCAEWTRQEYGLDRVLFVTSAKPPHNHDVAESAETRHEMVVAAVAGNPYFDASRVDLDRKTVSYALLTVEQVQREYGEDVELFYLLSSEYLDPRHPSYLGNWMGTSALFKLCKFLVFPKDRKNIEQVKAWAAAIPDANIEVMEHAPVHTVSSEMIRDLVRRNKSVWYTTPWSVQQIIAKSELYR